MIRLLIPAVALVLAMANPLPAIAAQSSWAQGMGAKLRLIAPGGETWSAQMVTAGIEIQLKDGWKTYWRNPGANGIPPNFDFSASTNVGDVEVRYPVPKRDPLGAEDSLIYKGTVVFPLRIVPADPALPIVLRLNALYGVCEVVCVPERSEATLLLSRSTPFDGKIGQILTKAESRIPQPLAADSPVAVAAVETEHPTDPSKRALNIKIKTDRQVETNDLFLEGPPDWYVGVPTFVGMEADIAHYRLTLTTIPEEAVVSGAPIRMTIVSGARAYETTRQLP